MSIEVVTITREHVTFPGKDAYVYYQEPKQTMFFCFAEDQRIGRKNRQVAFFGELEDASLIPDSDDAETSMLASVFCRCILRLGEKEAGYEVVAESTGKFVLLEDATGAGQGGEGRSRVPADGTEPPSCLGQGKEGEGVPRDQASGLKN